MSALVGAGGGVAVVRDGNVIALVELPIGGLMSDEPADVVAEKSARVMRALGECGCALNNGYMQLSLLKSTSMTSPGLVSRRITGRTAFGKCRWM